MPVLIERSNRGEGLARPELAVLLSYSKIQLYDELLASDLPDDRYMEALLVDYFPTALRKTYKKQIAGHRLRREIIARTENTMPPAKIATAILVST